MRYLLGVFRMGSAPQVVGFVRDSAIIADICAEIGSNGGLLICNGCGDIEAIIAALLVIDDDHEAWALCGNCMHKFPLEGPIV